VHRHCPELGRVRFSWASWPGGGKELGSRQPQSDSRKDASGRGFEPEVIASQPFRDLFLRSLLPRLGGGISTGLRQEGFLMVAFGRLSGSQIRRSGEAIPRAGLSTRGRAVKVTP